MYRCRGIYRICIKMRRGNVWTRVVTAQEFVDIKCHKMVLKSGNFSNPKHCQNPGILGIDIVTFFRITQIFFSTLKWQKELFTVFPPGAAL
jgi:hypothetical protein